MIVVQVACRGPELASCMGPLPTLSLPPIAVRRTSQDETVPGREVITPDKFGPYLRVGGGFEPSTCCIRNSFRLFRWVRQGSGKLED